MPNSDTIKLLKECNFRIKIGVQSINEVIGNVEDKQLIDILNKYPESSSEVKELASDIINLEENFSLDLRKFL